LISFLPGWRPFWLPFLLSAWLASILAFNFASISSICCVSIM
jgi:hypothetical protein